MKYLLFVLALSFFSFAYSQKYDLKFNLEGESGLLAIEFINNVRNSKN